MEESIQWMLHGPAWIRYNVLISLLDRKRGSPQVISAGRARKAIPALMLIY